jgi:hypothetical protein
MTHSKHSKHPHHSTHHPDHPGKKPLLFGLHKDWRAWLALGLMLAAIGMYVLTLDDAVQPEVAVTNAPPAAAQSASPSK